MKITLENTTDFAHVNGVPARVWTGSTESGTPIVALITRIGVDGGADAGELQRELSEPPTRIVDPLGSTVASPRACTVCLGRDIRSPARFVARDAGGLEWFECGDHGSGDNLAETVRVALEPIVAWFDRHERAVAVSVGTLGPNEPLEARNAELASECRSLRVRLKDAERGGPGWLVKDFHVDPSGETVAAPRSCTVCNGRGQTGKPALYVAGADDGLEWFECADHSPTDNLAGETRTRLEPIADWFARHELPVPGAAPPREPLRLFAVSAAQVAVLKAAHRWIADWEDNDAEPHPDELPAEHALYQAVSKARAEEVDAELERRGEIPPRGEVPPARIKNPVESRAERELDRHRDRLAHILDEAFGLQPVADLAELLDMLETELGRQTHRIQALRQAFESRGREPSWLVKDFHSLYRAAAATLQVSTLPQTVEARSALRLEIERTLPAFQTCERERRDAADQQSSLDAARSALDALERVSDALVICDGLEPQLSDPFHCAVRGIRVALTGADPLSPRPAAAAHGTCEHAEPPLAHDIITRIVDDDRAVDAAFVLQAMRGARLGWHARHAHPHAISLTGRRGAPLDEPHRSSWLVGYRLGAGLDPAAPITEEPAAGDRAETPTAPATESAAAPEECAEPLVLTDADRYRYESVLVYRAPSALTARDRKIVAAIDAERANLARSPDEWLGAKPEVQA